MSDLNIRFEEYEEYEDDDGFEESDSERGVRIVPPPKNDGVPRAFKIVIAVLAACALGELAFYQFIRPSLSAPIVSVSGNRSYTSAELVDMLRPMNAQNWFDFDVEAAVSILASVPGLDSVRVYKTFPNKIYISVLEREPVAMTFLNNQGRSVAVQIDKNGVLFPEHSGDGADFGSMPIVSGLPVEHMTEGMRIPVKYRQLIEQIAAIQRLPQNYFTAISEICVVPKEYGNYELVLIPFRSTVRVLTDRTLNEDALKYMMVVLDVVNLMEPDVAEIDLRYGSVSYRKR
ncbi:MAG: FtsQ-type POTRA domain-containing protein [Treponemataceae bacterium]|nr:FtsQ-type POTRA domain-containing protein [Treponemataceae bacterium]